MRFTILFLLFFGCSFGQYPIELKIESIIPIDSTSSTYRTYTVNYSIKNISDKEVAFINCQYPINIMYPDVKKPIVVPYIYENDSERKDIKLKTNIQYLKINNISNYKNAQEAAKQNNIEYEKALAKKVAEMKAKREERLKINDIDYVKSAIVKLKPNERRDFTETYYWDKVRYFKIDDLEYYIDEDAKFYFELKLNLHKQNFQYFFSEKEYENIKNNPNFLEGIIRSNKIEINFKNKL
jgi:hypothetical protein